jgi:hypothetical protein
MKFFRYIKHCFSGLDRYLSHKDAPSEEEFERRAQRLGQRVANMIPFMR